MVTAEGDAAWPPVFLRPFFARVSHSGSFSAYVRRMRREIYLTTSTLAKVRARSGHWKTVAIAFSTNGESISVAARLYEFSLAMDPTLPVTLISHVASIWYL